MAGGGGYAAGADFTLADRTLALQSLVATMLTGTFRSKPILDGRPKLAAWYGSARPSVKEALGEQMAALEAFQIEVLGEQMAAIEAILGALR